ncbi:MAG: tetratricopeptide repeat protein [Myxococcota bacterium]
MTAALEVPTEDAPAAPLAAPGAAAEVAAAPSPAVDASADPAVEVGRVDARPVDDGAGAPRSPLPPWGRLGAGASVVPDAGDETTGASAGCRCDAATRSPGSLAHEAPRMSPRFFDAARQQLDAGRAWAALARFKRAVATAPKDPNAWFGLALARTDLGQTSLARKAARRALAVDPAHAGATLLLGFLAQQQHDVAAARQLYAHYLELEPEGPWAAEVQAVIAQLP